MEPQDPNVTYYKQACDEPEQPTITDRLYRLANEYRRRAEGLEAVARALPQDLTEPAYRGLSRLLTLEHSSLWTA